MFCCLHTFFQPTLEFQQISAFILYRTFWKALRTWSLSTWSQSQWVLRSHRHQVPTLSWQQFREPKAVYMCFHTGIHGSSMLEPAGRCHYSGSTVQTLFLRRNARIRKLSQLSQNKLVKCELALRYWQTTGTFFEYVTVPWILCKDNVELRVRELKY